jgi:hypothetical protein
MKILRTTICLLFALLFSSVHAQSTPPDSRSSLLAGSWVGRATRPDGLTIEAFMSLTRDGNFSGHINANGKPAFTYEGTWKLAGKRLNWVYTKTSPELSEAARLDSDELISVDAKTLVLRSDLSGETRTFQRQP